MKADHTAEAIVGGAADLNSNEDLEVRGEISQNLTISTEATSAAPEDSQSVGLSAAVSIGIIDNVAHATIGEGAELDALRATRVISDISYPFLTRPDEFIPTNLGELADVLKGDNSGELINVINGDVFDSFNQYLDGTLGLRSGLFNLWTRATGNAGSVSVAGSAVALVINNDSKAVVLSGAQINQDPLFRSVDPMAPDQHTVSIEATNYLQMVNVTGIFQFSFLKGELGDIENLDPSLMIDPVASSGSKGGVGGTIYLSFLDNTTYAIVEEGAAIFSGASGGFNMKAEEAIADFSLNQAGAQSGQYAFAGTFAYAQQDSDTLVRLSNDAIVTGRNAVLYAGNLETKVTLSGGVAQGQNLGFGVSIGVNNIDRRTRAIIGDPDLATADGRTFGADLTNIDVDEDISILARNDGELWALSLAAAIASDMPMSMSDETADNVQDTDDNGDVDPDDPLDGISLPLLFGEEPAGTETQDAMMQGRASVAVAGDASVNLVDDEVIAAINDAGVIRAGGALDVAAENRSELVVAAGAAAFAEAQEGSRSVGIAGSFSLNLVDGRTDALIVGAPSLRVAALDVSAERTGGMFTLTAGGAAAPKRDGITVAGSASFNRIGNDTRALVENVDIRGADGLAVAGDIGVSASDDSNIIAIAGAISIAGDVGVGAALGINLIDVQTESALRDAALDRAGALSVSATNDSDIFSLTGSGSVAGGMDSTFAGSGTISVNVIGDLIGRDNEVTAEVENVLDESEGGAVSVLARDDREIISIAGARAVTDGNAAFGVSGAYNGGFGSITARIADSSLRSNDGVSVRAQSSANIVSVSIAAAVAATSNFAGAGAVSVNEIESDVDAEIVGSVLDVSAGEISVTAEDDSFINADAGGVAVAVGNSGGTQASFGISIAANLITSSATALVDASDLTAPGRIEVAAMSDAEIIAITIAGSVATTGGGGDPDSQGGGASLSIAGAGAGSGNFILDASAEALVTGGSNLTSTGDDVDVLADASARIIAASGAAAIAFAGGMNGGNAVGVGVSLAVNSIAGRSTARLSGSTASAGGAITIDAKSTGDIVAVSVAGAVGGSGGQGGGFSFSGAAAGAGNVIGIDTTAEIVGGSATAAGGDVAVGAADMSTINAAVGAAAISVAAGQGGGTAAAIGAAIAVNEISGDIAARIDGADVAASGGVTVSAASEADIFALTVSAAAGGGGGQSGGLAITGAGAGSGNIITGDTTAEIVGGADVDANGGDLSVTASNASEIIAAAGAVGLSFAGGQGGGNAVGVGLSIAVNDIGSDVLAQISASDATASGAVMVDASSTAEIFALTVAGAVAGGGGQGGALLFSGAGAASGNTIGGSIEALI